MENIIRKISVGKEYPNGAMHYQVGSFQNLKGEKYRVTDIMLNRELLSEKNKMAFDIYIVKEPKTSTEIVSKILWKTIVDVPVVVENNIVLD